MSFTPQLHSVFGRQYRVIRIQDNKAQEVGTVTGQGRPEDLGRLADIETQTEGTRRPGDTLRAAAVSRSFEGVQALAGVDLELHDHEVVGLIGPNGAGKSTLVNVITGFDRADEGTVELERPGRDALEPAPPRACGPRPHVPAQPLLPRPLGAGERRGRGARGRGRAARGAGAGRRAARARSASPSTPTRRPPTSPTATSGASASRGRSRREPRFVLMDEPAAGLPEAEVPDFAAVVRRCATSTAPACS